MSYTYTVRFREIRHSAQRRLKCRTCGKRFTRSRTFTQTVNPYNRNADGEQKTPMEIHEELVAEAAAWSPSDLCTKCSEDVPR